MAGIETRVEVPASFRKTARASTKGTQAVLRGLDDPRLFKSAIQGALADLIQVEPRYIPAIEAGLGPGLEAIIFKDTTAAKLALGQLKRRRLGRASVVPRDWISANEDSSSLTHGDFRAAPAGSAQTTGNSAAAGRNNGVRLPEEGIAWGSELREGVRVRCPRWPTVCSPEWSSRKPWRTRHFGSKLPIPSSLLQHWPANSSAAKASFAEGKSVRTGRPVGSQPPGANFAP